MSARITRGWARAQHRMVNFRATPADQKIIEDLALATDRDVTFIVRKAIRRLTIEDLMEALEPGEAGGNGEQQEPSLTAR